MEKDRLSLAPGSGSAHAKPRRPAGRAQTSPAQTSPPTASAALPPAGKERLSTVSADDAEPDLIADGLGTISKYFGSFSSYFGGGGRQSSR